MDSRIVIHIFHSLPDGYENTNEILETELERDEATSERVKEKISKGFGMSDKSLFTKEKFQNLKETAIIVTFMDTEAVQEKAKQQKDR